MPLTFHNIPSLREGCEVTRGEGIFGWQDSIGETTLAFPPQTDPVFMRESHPGVARKGFSQDEEDTTHDRSDY